LEPEIEVLCSQLLSRLDANVEEIQQMLTDTSSQEVTVYYFLVFTELLLLTFTNYFMSGIFFISRYQLVLVSDTSKIFLWIILDGKDLSENQNGNCRRTGGIPTRKGDKRSNHESQNTDAQGMRAPTTTLYVLCGLQKSV